MKEPLDPKVLFLTRNLDILSLVRSYFPEYEPDGLVLCPSHEDSKVSLHINPHGKAYCHSCGFFAKDIVDLISKLDNLPYREVKDMLYNDYVDAIPEAQVTAYQLRLPWHGEAWCHYLVKRRNLSSRVGKDYKLGLDPSDNRITIPIYDQFGSCVNIRRMGWLKEHKEKALNMNGHGEVRLFPENKIVMERRLLLVEGEWDCLCGRAFGLPTVTWTGGASNWNEKYENFFKGKAVWVWYDNDEAGRKGQEQALQRLGSLPAYLNTVSPPSLKENDLTEYSFSGPNFLEWLRDTIKAYKFPKRALRKKYCVTCGQEVK